MIKNADLDQEYFVVLTFKSADLAPAIKIQKIIANKYDLYEDSTCPELHITLDRVKKEKVDQAQEIINQITQENDPITIEIENLKCFRHTNNFLVLDVTNTSSLEELAESIHQQLAQKNISTIENYKEWNFHITLISNLFADNPIPKFDLDQLCLNLDGIPHQISTTAKAIEIWRPKLEPETKLISSFEL
ncbi:MAG: 2'-5' RNA ligase family protein [Bacillota bacterium]